MGRCAPWRRAGRRRLRPRLGAAASTSRRCHRPRRGPPRSSSWESSGATTSPMSSITSAWSSRWSFVTGIVATLWSAAAPKRRFRDLTCARAHPHPPSPRRGLRPRDPRGRASSSCCASPIRTMPRTFRSTDLASDVRSRRLEPSSSTATTRRRHGDRRRHARRGRRPRRGQRVPPRRARGVRWSRPAPATTRAAPRRSTPQACRLTFDVGDAARWRAHAAVSPRRRRGPLGLADAGGS